MKKATEDLVNEHNTILQVLTIMEKVVTVDKRDTALKLEFGRELVFFLKTFADQCHHGKEEGYLFPELINAGVQNQGGPIGVMLHEHVLGREYITSMSSALDENNYVEFVSYTEKYISLLRNHINKENNVLFPMADRLLDESRQNDLFEKFEEHEEYVIGHGVHEQLHSMIGKWENDLIK